MLKTIGIIAIHILFNSWGTAQDNFHPQWSPTQDLIVFDSDIDGVRALYTIKPDGSDLSKLPIAFDSSMVHPSWSPDGQSLVFETQSANNWDLFIVNVDGTGLKRLTKHKARDFLGNWSPDGDLITFISDRDGDSEVYSIGVDGTRIKQLTQNDVSENGPIWSLDGRNIIFGSNRSGSWEIYSMTVEGLQIKQLTTRSGSYGIASESQNGITFISLIDQQPFLQRINENGQLKLVFPNPTGNGVPSWNNSGTRVTMFKQVDNHNEIYIFDADHPLGIRLTYINK